MDEYIVELSYDPVYDCIESQDIVKESIVRCKDCEHGLWDGKMCDRVDPCYDEHWFAVEPDGFCAWGERRDD